MIDSIFQEGIDTQSIYFKWFKEKASNIEHIDPQQKQVYKKVWNVMWSSPQTNNSANVLLI